MKRRTSARGPSHRLTKEEFRAVIDQLLRLNRSVADLAVLFADVIMVVQMLARERSGEKIINVDELEATWDKFVRKFEKHAAWIADEVERGKQTAVNQSKPRAKMR